MWTNSAFLFIFWQNSDDNTYYVNEYGVRAKNQWISVENEDDADVNGEEVDTLWYYFGDNGKAYKADTDNLKKKTCPYWLLLHKNSIYI